MYNAVLKAFNVDKKDVYNESKDSTFNAAELSNTSTFKSSKNFKLVISEEKWAQIKPKRQTYGLKKRKIYGVTTGQVDTYFCR